MKVRVELNPAPRIIKRLGLSKDGDVQRFFTSEVLRRIQKYMPYRTGETIKLTIAQTDINKPEIVTDEPQARYLFYGVSKAGKPLNYTRTKNYDAGPRWDRALATAEKEAISASVRNYIKVKKGG